MKPFSFLNRSIQRERTLKKWMKTSALLIIIALSSIICIELKQLMHFFKLKTEYINLGQFIQDQQRYLEKKNKLVKIKQELESRYSKLNQDSKIYNYLTLLSKLLPQDNYLTEFTYTQKQKIILKGQSKTYQSLTTFIRDLSLESNLVSQVTLAHVTSDDNTGNLTYEIHISL